MDYVFTYGLITVINSNKRITSVAPVSSEYELSGATKPVDNGFSQPWAVQRSSSIG